MKRRGFTLIELSFVIAIIAVLAAILFPTFSRAREASRRASCASNLLQIGVALNMYAQSYDGHYPKKNNEFGPVFRYTGNTDIFFCPSDPAEHHWDMKPVVDYDFSGKAVIKQTYSSYVYRGGLCSDDRADRVIAGEAVARHGDIVNVLYLGGYVRGTLADKYKPVVEPTQKPVEKPTPKPSAMPGPPPPSGG